MYQQLFYILFNVCPCSLITGSLDGNMVSIGLTLFGILTAGTENLHSYFHDVYVVVFVMLLYVKLLHFWLVCESRKRFKLRQSGTVVVDCMV